MVLPSVDSGRSRALAVLAVVAVSLAVYAPSIGYGFVFDDYPVVVQNELIRSLDRLPALVSSPEWKGLDHEMYRPLTGVTYALNHAMSGLSPWSYHATNVVLHAIASGLLVGVGLAFGLSLAAATGAALLFAIHPIHVEAVAGVVGRKDLLPAVLAFATVLLHRRALLRGGPSLAWPALAFAGALLSKESGVVAVGLVILLDLTHPRPDGAPVPLRRRAAVYAGYAVALAVYLLVRSAVVAWAAKPTTLGDNVAAHVGSAVRVMTAIAVIGKGLALQFMPLGQCPDWSFRAITFVGTPGDPRLLATVAALGAWLAVGVAVRRRTPLVLVGLAWYLGTLLPTSNLLFPTGVIFGERLLYLASAGLAIALAAAASLLARRIPRAALGAALAGVALACCAATLSYSYAWGDEFRLFRLAAERVPDASRVRMILAFLLLERGEPSAALAEADRAIALSPWFQGAHIARAQALGALGRLDEAAQASRTALAAPGGDIDLQLRPPDPRKLRALRAALDTSPRDAEALYGLATLARDAGEFDEAETLWRKAIAANPRHARALADLAGHERLLGHGGQALSLALLAVDSDPSLASAWDLLGKLYRGRGDSARSRQAYERFLSTAGSEDSREVEKVRRLLDP